ncbi:Type II/IV secretion system, ATPase component, VirB11/GspE family [Thermoproteus tenax Kra 1]|uniref:Type II/IV secretion system, ATPase component, VirB11/GspE family n=2 Tax=Thermoproteus tenax TaxID=2271 RepID=G4RPQ4_THETK|nr:Type II/IV secretion system, ATPase component, VirB11/GspE family [Thermoproteus tenax Kra 1]
MSARGLGFKIERCPGVPVEEYGVEGARITIHKFEDGYCYSVNYAFPYSDKVGEYVYKIVEYLTARQVVRPDMTREELGKLIEMAMADVGVPKPLRAPVRFYVQLEAADYSYLTPLLYDVKLENVNINGTDNPIYVDHRDYGYNIKTNIVPTDKEVILRIVSRVYAETGRPLNEQYPIQDTYLRLSNGALLRFATAMSNKTSRNPPYVSVRIQPPEPISPTKLIKNKTISALGLAYLWYLFENLMIIGGTGSGKTTLLNALLVLLPHKRIAVAEETPEIRLPKSFTNSVLLFTSPLYDYQKNLPGSESAIYLIDLVRFLLRARPDIVVIGESRGREIHELIQGILTGHGGATTFHAEDMVEAFMRMTGEAMGVSPEHISAFSAVAVVRKFDWGRRVTSLTEIVWLRAYPFPALNRIKIKEEEFGLVEVGTYDRNKDTFTVDLKRSFWLQKLGGVEEVMARAELLQALADKGVIDAEAVAEAVRQYYRLKRKI